MVKDAAEIEAWVKERGITHLVHFTRVENLPSIFANGLVPKSNPAVKLINNQSDGFDDRVCLSLIHPSRMFMAMRYQHEDEDWCVLVISPRLLWEQKCLFYPINAVSRILRDQPEDYFEGFDALNRMFDIEVLNPKEVLETRPKNLLNSMPTNEQAEVHAIGGVGLNYIYQAFFETKTDISKIESLQWPLHIQRFKGENFWQSRGYLLSYSQKQDYLKWLKDRFS
jgi:hypothetical protein